MAESTQWTILWYRTATGEQPIKTFLSALTGRNRDEAAALLEMLRARGLMLGAPNAKPVREGVRELRGHEVRIFYTFRPGRRIVLLDGMIKKQDRLPAEIVDRVVGFKRDLEAREGS